MQPANDRSHRRTAPTTAEQEEPAAPVANERDVDLEQVRQAVADYTAALRRTIERLAWRDDSH